MPVRELRSDEDTIPAPLGGGVRELNPNEKIQEPSLPGRAISTFGVTSGSAALRAGVKLRREREERRSRKVGALTGALGPRYDSSDVFDGGVLMQMDLARNQLLSVKQKKFRETFPNGSLISVNTPDGPALLARRSLEEAYRELSIGPQIAGTMTSEPVILGTIGSFFGPGGTLVGTGAGVLIQGEIEEARGFGEGKSPEDKLAEAAQEGIIAGAIDLTLRGVGRVFLGRIRPQSEADALREALKGADTLGLEPLATGQMGGPFQRGIFRQVGVTSPRVEQKITAQQQSLLKKFRALGDDAPESQEILLNVIRAQQAELDDILLKMPSLRRADAGEALQRGIETWKEATRRLRNRLYNKAHALSDDITYDLNSAQSAAADIKQGVLGQGREVTRIEASSLVDEFGLPITREITERQTVFLAETPQGQLKSVVDDILALDPSISKFSAKGGEFTAFEQIKTLRTRLFDLKHSEDGGVRREANRLWRELTKTMDNPISGDPDFVAAHRVARGFNRLREDTLEKTFVARTLVSDTPDQIGAKFFRPGNSTALATIMDIIPRPRWMEFRAAFRVDIMNSPTATQGLNRLRNFRAADPDGLGILIAPAEERELIEFLVRKAQFESSPARKILLEKMTEGEQIIALAEKGTAGQVDDAVRLSGGVDSDYAQAARAGVYRTILREATIKNVSGVEVIDASIVLRQINKWRKSGKLDSLFRPGDWEVLEAVEKYTAILNETADVGGAMMAGSLRQEAIKAPTGIWSDAKGIGKRLARPLISNEITAWLLSRGATAARIRGVTRDTIPIRNIGIALAITQRRLEREASIGGPNG